MLPDYIEKSLHRIAGAQGMRNYKIESDTTSLGAGEGFLGILNSVTITNTIIDTEQSKLHEKLHLVYKIAPTNEMRRKHFKAALLFEREIDMYTKVLPAFMRFQQEKGLSVADSFTAFPKLYASEFDAKNDIYFLIMEDLRSGNFSMWPKKKPLPLDRVEGVLIELGKFHAISFAMQDQQPNVFDQFRSYYDVSSEILFNGKLNTAMLETIDRVISVLKSHKHKEILRHFRQTYIQRIDKLLNGAPSKEFAVIGHGDCWNSNIMYRNENSVLNSIRFLDWQLSRYGSNVIDVMFFIFTVTDRPYRQQHYHRSLEIYYRSLSETITKLGSDPQKLFTFENLQSKLREFGDYIVLYAPLLIQVCLASGNIANLDDYSERIDCDQSTSFISELDNQTADEYALRINDLFTDLDSYGYLGNLKLGLNKQQ